MIIDHTYYYIQSITITLFTPISQVLFRNYKSSLPNFLIYFILYQIESIQLENLLRIGVRKLREVLISCLTNSTSEHDFECFMDIDWK